jgi:hypothetical protein
MAVGTVACYSSLSLNNTFPNGPVTGQWLGGSDSDAQGYGRRYQKTSQMTLPSPSDLFIFCEEHPNSINDSTLAVQIANYSLGDANWIDVPGNLHSGADPFSFADGHAETHQWQGSIVGAVKYIQGASIEAVQPDDTAETAADLKDLNWVQARTSYPIPQVPNFPKP